LTTHEFRSLIEVLRFRAQVQKDSLVYTFLRDGETPSDVWSFGELDRRSRVIAATLQKLNARGERALLLYPAGLEFIAAFLGCLYAGVVAVPSYPPHPTRPGRHLSRLQAIGRDATVRLVLATQAIVAHASILVKLVSTLAGARWLATDHLADEATDTWQESVINPETVAFLQYTSGSTGTPRGVVVSHANLLHNLAYAQACGKNDTERVGVSWLPAYHDMGLIEGLLQPLFSGYPAYLMSPAAFLQRPIRWLQAISRFRGTNSGGPNFAYDLCVRKIPPEERDSLDLRSWLVAYSGAEPIRRETLQRFVEAFGRCGFREDTFYPAYGLAEATLLVSTKPFGEMPVFRAVDVTGLAHDRAMAPSGPDVASVILPSCGRFSSATKVIIVNPETHRLCAPGEVGEVWISGPSVAQGYWQRPAETEQTFRAYLAETGDGPFLRTGDLGFIADGELFVTGRLKDVIIVRGQKHYPQDIELTVEQSHPAIQPGGVAAFAIDTPSGESVGVVVEIDRRRLTGTRGRKARDLHAMIGVVRETVAEQHELQLRTVVLIKPGGLPRTSSGKLQRLACQAHYRAGSLAVLAEWVHQPA